MKLPPFSGITNIKYPPVFNGVFSYVKNVASDPFDLLLGLMWTAYVVGSVKDLTSDVLDHQKTNAIRKSQKKITQEKKFVSKFFTVANVFKWMDWAGQSKVTGATKYAFPRLSVIADVFYIYVYGYECVSGLSESRLAKKAANHHLSSVKSKKYYKAKEMKELANYISNYSYLCFSGMSAAVFFTNTTLLTPVMAGAIGVYFLFLAIGGVANAALEEASVKNKNIHWIKADSKRRNCI